ncbi:SDR family oxidoreductase [Pilimelia columellifera]|uniref:SDR family oxidoreductase n=1 Tax=Pilimelia columellifera subsp. columellifera TaxID=706583 RepID=A0ABN3NBN3_9ACTN
MTGKVLVTGGASGLGAAVVTAVRKADGEPCVLDLRPPTEDVPYEQCDLADSAAAHSATERIIERMGGVDAVVAAAGVDVPGRLEDVPAQQWERVVRINLFGTAAVIRAALPTLRASHGSVVTVASTLGVKAVSDASAYCASKFGVVGFTRALAAELAGEVGVTLLVPGGMRTAFFDDRAEQYRPGPDVVLNDPDNVAQTVLFAISQPAGCAVRELVVCAAQESSYP